jgi:phosphoribosylformylglycinamidine synthase
MNKVITDRAPFAYAETSHLEALLAAHKITKEDHENILSILERQPTLAELGVFSAMWSEHCSYKSSRVHLKKFPTKGPHVVIGPGENAGVVRLKDKLCLAFKMESHNHPSYIDPYQGAATGVGGILRDVFCMGARPVALLNALRFGEKSHAKSPWLCENVVKGIGDYGNCVGVPTVAGSTHFDPSYNGNILVNAMACGIVHEDKIFTGSAAGVGNLIYYVGAATGRDGIHGATMASASFDDTKEEERSAVQVGDPFFEKLLLEATLEVLEKKLVVGLQDMGAAGLTSSVFEMASRAGTGVFLDLNSVPTRTVGMSPYELMLSESQERMLMVIEPKHQKELEAVFEKWDLAYNKIGVITDTKKVEAVFNEKLHIDMFVEPLVERAPLYTRPMKKQEPSLSESPSETWQTLFLKENLEHMIAKLCAGRVAHEAIYEQYDQEVGLRTVLSQEGGGASVLEIFEPDCSPQPVGIALAANCLENYCGLEPREGARQSVYKVARSIIATGATPFAITDCLNWGNPEIPEIMWSFAEAVEGITQACEELETPVVSGNVSLYNETNGKSILPTPMIGMVGLHDNPLLAKQAVCSEKDFTIYLLSYKENATNLPASHLWETLKYELPNQVLTPIQCETEKEANKFIHSLAKEENIFAIKDIDREGILPSLLRLSQFTGSIETFCDKEKNLELYLAGIVGGYLIVLPPSFEENFEEKGKELKKNKLTKIACVKKEGDTLIFLNEKISLFSLKEKIQKETKELFH